jgi:medium-chain acyl-[acyl-carrier-protein] hydrolase
MSAAMPAWVELSILQLPGREALFGAPMYQAMKPLVDAILPIITTKLDLPYAFFGHSLGSHVAFEIARQLRHRNPALPSPRALIPSGARAPHLPFRRLPLHNLPTPRLIEELRRYGGTPEAVLQNQELMDIFLPPLRADLTVFETYSYAPDEPFDFPITAFGGKTDHRLDADEVEAWEQHTTGRFSATTFEGGHFYLLEGSRPLFLASLRQTLETFG